VAATSPGTATPADLGWLRSRWPTTRPLSTTLVDVAIAVGALVVSLTQLSHGGIGPLQTATEAEIRDAPWSLDAVGVALAAAASLPLLLRRRHPYAVFAVTAAASLLLAALAYPLDLVVGAAIALYFVAASRDPGGEALPVPLLAVVVSVLVTYVAAIALARDAVPASAGLHTGLAWTVAWFAGERSRLRESRLAELRARAGRAEQDAARDRRLAAAEERARIARDLHDSAGHAVSVIAVRAGAARLRHAEDPDRSRTALEAIEQLARDTGAEIDRIVGHLRSDDRPDCPRGSWPSPDGRVAPPLGMASLGDLVAQHRTAGHEVTLSLPDPPPALSPAADQAAYRIVQEALTNAVRHGSGLVRVELHVDAAALAITVTNPVADHDDPATTGTVRPHGGHGLIGMRERASLVGGTLDVRRADGEFRLHARLPTTAG
jgi:signal transduction histidine kinase